MKSQHIKSQGHRFQAKDFRKASGCSPERWACVGVAMRPNVVAVRNTRDPKGVTVMFNRREWVSFTNAVKLGEFDC